MTHSKNVTPSNKGAYGFTAQLIMVCFCGWIIVNSDFLVLIFLIIPAALISLALAIPALVYKGGKGYIVGLCIAMVANIAIYFAHDIGKIIEYQIASFTALRDMVVTPTHYVSSPTAIVEFRPKESNSETAIHIKSGTCVRVHERLAKNTFYSIVTVPTFSGKRYISFSDLDYLGQGQKCDADHQLVRR